MQNVRLDAYDERLNENKVDRWQGKCHRSEDVRPQKVDRTTFLLTQKQLKLCLNLYLKKQKEDYFSL